MHYRGIFFSVVTGEDKNSFVRSFICCNDTGNTRFTSTDTGKIFVTDVRSTLAIGRAAKDDDERLTTAYRGRRVYTSDASA